MKRGKKCYPQGVGRWGAPLTGAAAPAAYVAVTGRVD